MKVQNTRPDITKYYLVRSGNVLRVIKSWIKWAEKNSEN